MNTNPREPRRASPVQQAQPARRRTSPASPVRKRKKGIRRFIRNLRIAAGIIAEEALAFLKRCFTGKRAKTAIVTTVVCAVVLTAIISAAAIASRRDDMPMDLPSSEDDGEDGESTNVSDTVRLDVEDGTDRAQTDSDDGTEGDTGTEDVPSASTPADPSLPTQGPVIPESAGYSTVTVTFWGKESLVYDTRAESVGEFLKEANIRLDPTQTKNVDESAPITDGMTVAADLVTYETKDVEEVLEYTTEYRDSAAFPKGTTKVTQYGKNGKQTRRYTVTLVNGVEVAREQTASWIDQSPTTHIITNGVGVVVSDSTQKPDADGSGGTFVGADGVERRYAYYIDVSATCYYQGGITASGLVADENVIAVDPRVIPLGTRVYVTGSYGDFGERIAADTGGDIKGYKIDVCIDPNHPLAYNFGWRDMRVYILE